VRRYPQEVEDAARVLYQADTREAANPGAGMADANKHAEALARAEEQMARGEAVSVADVAPIVAASRAMDEQIAAVEAQIAQQLPIAGALAERGEIRSAREQLALMEQTRVDTSEAAVRVEAKDIQARDGASYKTALAQAKKQVSDRAANWQAQFDRLTEFIAVNAKAQQATQRIGELQGQLDGLRRQAESPVVSWAKTLAADLEAARNDKQFSWFFDQTGAGKRQAEPVSPDPATKQPPGAPKDATGKTEPADVTAAAAPARLDTIRAQYPDMMVAMDGAEPMRMDDFLAAAKAEADELSADAPLMQAAAECALTFGG